MSLFAVFVTAGKEKVKERLDEIYPDHYFLGDIEDAFFVRSEDLSETIANNLGIKSEDKPNGIAGVVFKMNNAYSGYTKRSLWEWLDK